MDYILIGKIVNTHGIKGEIKVYPYTDDIDNLSKIKQIYLDKELTKVCNVDRCRIQKNMLIVKLKDIDIIEDAVKLKDMDIYIPRSSLKKLDKDSYYIADLIGIEVFDINNNYIGIFKDSFNCGANDVYEIATDSGSIYLPAIKQVIKKVDIENKKMYVEIMKGLV